MLTRTLNLGVPGRVQQGTINPFSELLFKSSSFDFGNSLWLDESGNGNNAALVQSNCGTAKTTTVLTFATALSGILANWVMTYSGTAVPVLSLNNITFSGAGTIYNIRLTNATLGVSNYYPCSEGWLKAYDVSGNGKHLSIGVSTLAEWTANKQNTLHYNLQKGGGLTSGNLLLNPTLEGAFTSGLAASWTDFSTTSKTQESVIVHSGTKAQRFTAILARGIYQSLACKKGFLYKFGVWVYVVSGRAAVNITGSGIAETEYVNKVSTTIGAWEYLETEVHAKADGFLNFRIVTDIAGSDIIFDDANTWHISPTISIPALEAGVNDVLGNAIAVQCNSIHKTETCIKLPQTADLIASDVDSYFFTAGVANNAPMSIMPFALKNMVYDNTVFYDDETCKLMIYKNNVGSGSKLKALLTKLSKPIYNIFNNYKEFVDYDWESRINVVSVNRNFRVGIKANRYIVRSPDSGVTWGTPVDFTNVSANILLITITSKGSVILFMTNNVIKRSADGITYTTITPTLNGSPIVPHVPVNSSYPGTYYRPYHKVCDVYNESDNSNIIAWGNWGNTGYGANPAFAFYSTDDCQSIKVFYQFGQNTHYRDNGTIYGGLTGTIFGDAGNAKIARHIHEISYNPYSGKFYATTGDDHTNNEIHVLEFTYNKGTDTWSVPTDLVSVQSQRQRLIGLGFDADGYVYFGSDGSTQDIVQNSVHYKSTGVFRVLPQYFDDLSKYETLYDCNDIVVSFYKKGSILLFNINLEKTIRLSVDNGKNWVNIDSSDYCYWIHKLYSLNINIAPAMFMSSSQDDILVTDALKFGFYLNVAT